MSKTLKRLVAAALIAAAGMASASPTLVIEDGKLAGAKRVNVEGVYFDVSFVDGTYAGVYPGGSSPRFLDNEAGAIAAANALMGQVLIDGTLGEFDSVPGLTKGCSAWHCDLMVPWAKDFIGYHRVFAAAVLNYDAGSEAIYEDRVFSGLNTAWASGYEIDFTDYTAQAWTIWVESADQSADVPEPGTAGLVGGALMGLLGLKRTRRKL